MSHLMRLILFLFGLGLMVISMYAPRQRPTLDQYLDEAAKRGNLHITAPFKEVEIISEESGVGVLVERDKNGILSVHWVARPAPPKEGEK